MAWNYKMFEYFRIHPYQILYLSHPDWYIILKNEDILTGSCRTFSHCCVSYQVMLKRHAFIYLRDSLIYWEAQMKWGNKCSPSGLTCTAFISSETNYRCDVMIFKSSHGSQAHYVHMAHIEATTWYFNVHMAFLMRQTKDTMRWNFNLSYGMAAETNSDEICHLNVQIDVFFMCIFHSCVKNMSFSSWN